MKYNPAFLSEEELIGSFVVRQVELDLLVERIEENTGASNQHVLVIGPRGSGKTTLLLRIAAEVRRTPELHARWHVIQFAEETNEVYSLGQFWLEALRHLGEALQESDPSWLDTYNDLFANEHDEVRLRDRALTQLLDFADTRGKRLLLLVENLNELLGAGINDDEAWVLRETLQNEPRVMLLASATSQVEAFEHEGKAMFELFAETKLEPLNTDDCLHLWKHLTGQELDRRRIRPIEILTGGSPRLLGIISSFEITKSFRELMEEILHLVDDHTNYFRSCIDSLAELERRVFLALAGLWDPSTAREVDAAARIRDVNKVSAQLGRMVSRGIVTVVEERPRLKRYQVAERLLNIYHLMRRSQHSRQRVHAVVDFMIHFYAEDELLNRTIALAREACGGENAFREYHYETFAAIYERINSDDQRSRLIASIPGEFFTAQDAPDVIRDIVRERPDADDDKDEAKSLLPRVAQLVSANEHAEAEKVCREALRSEPDLALGWGLLGTFLTEKPDCQDEAEEAYRRAIELENDCGVAWMGLARLLHEKLERYAEAEEVYNKAIELGPIQPWTHANLGQLLHEKLGRYAEAEAAYRKAVELDPGYAWGWAQLGRLLHDGLGRYTEAEGVYNRAIELDPTQPWPHASLGQLLHEKLGRYAEAEAAYRKAVELEPNYAWAWAQLGLLLHEELERFPEAEEAYRKAIELEPEVAEGWVFLGRLLHEKLERYPEAEAAYRKAIELAPTAAFGWDFLGLLLHRTLDRPDEAEEAYRRAINLEPNVAPSWLFLGQLLHERLKRPGEALEMCQRALELDPACADGYLLLYELRLRADSPTDVLLQITRDAIAATGGTPRLLNGLADATAKAGRNDLLPHALEWVREAIAEEPDEPLFRATLVQVLLALREPSQALEELPVLLDDTELVSRVTEDFIGMLVDLAALGHAEGALRALQSSESRSLLEPLEVGLRMCLGEDLNVAHEIAEVAKDVVARIEDRHRELAEAPSPATGTPHEAE